MKFREMFSNFVFKGNKDSTAKSGGEELSLEAMNISENNQQLAMPNEQVSSLNLGPGWNFNNLQLKDKPQTELSLAQLAELHLAVADSNKNENSPFAFNLNDLELNLSLGKREPERSNEEKNESFGLNFLIPPVCDLPKIEEKTYFEIDIASALLLKPTLDNTKEARSNAKTVKKADKDLFVESSNVFEELYLLTETRRSNVKHFVVTTSMPSSSGFVVCRQWNHQQVSLKVHKDPASQTLVPFLFDTPSPDDVVKSAQSVIRRQ